MDINKFFYVSPVGCLDMPMLVWTQKSHKWSKLRGVPGDPDWWLPLRLKPYVQSNASEIGDFYAIGFDPKNNDIYWSDKRAHAIMRQNVVESMEGRLTGIETIYNNADSEVHSMYVDWLAGNTYFTEATHGWIAVLSGQQKQGDTKYKILFSGGVRNPRGITVDPREG